MSTPIIHCNSLVKKHYARVALNNLTFRLDEGEVLLVTGPSGSGKTSLINIISGIDTFNAGNLLIFDMDANKNKDFVKQISCSWQSPSLYQNLSIEKNLNFFSDLYQLPKRETYKEINDLLEGFDLINKRKQYLATLSQSDQKKVDLCRTLIGNKKLLILDEPFSLLDASSIKFLLNILINKKRQGCGIIISTKNISACEDLIDKILLLKDGNVIMNKKIDTVIERRDKVIVIKPLKPVDKIIFKKISFVNDVQEVGNVFHLRLKKDIPNLNELIPYFDELGISIENIRIKQPSLQAAVEEVLSNA